MKILFCPSDAGNTSDDAFNDHGDVTIQYICDPELSPGQGLTQLLAGGYQYKAHIFDKSEDDDVMSSPAAWGGADVEVPAQYLAWWAAVALNTEAITGVDYGLRLDDPSNPLVERLLVGFDVDMPIPDWMNGYLSIDADVELGTGGSDTLYRHREGIERFLITDINNPGASAAAQSDIAVYSDFVATAVSQFNHVPGGANVLYMDGHVEFIKYPGTWPITVGFANFYGSYF